MSLKTKKIRSDFPIFKENPKAIYFDNACITFKPQIVIDEIVNYYKRSSACAGRSLHRLGTDVTKGIQKARENVAKFINANPNEIIFTRNTTEGINLVSNSLPFQKGDVICTSDMEHNSNLLPWQFLTQRGEVDFIQFELTGSGEIDLEKFQTVLSENPVKLVSTFHTSNILGTQLPIEEMVKITHQHGAYFLLDAAQATTHAELDVKSLDVDFLAFSGHKAYGPTGTGVLYGKHELLKKLRPFIVGGETVNDVYYENCTLMDIPHRFEAGLQDYSGILGLSKALDYVQKLNPQKTHDHVIQLNQQLTDYLLKDDNIQLIGPNDPHKRSSVANFLHKSFKSEELCLLLDQNKQIMTRSGVHCGHAWYHKQELMPSLRVSFSAYNTPEEVDTLVKVLEQFSKFY